MLLIELMEMKFCGESILLYIINNQFTSYILEAESAIINAKDINNITHRKEQLKHE